MTRHKRTELKTWKFWKKVFDGFGRVPYNPSSPADEAKRKLSKTNVEVLWKLNRGRWARCKVYWSGGYAGVTANDLDSVAQKVAQTSNSTVGSIREIVTEKGGEVDYTLIFKELEKQVHRMRETMVVGSSNSIRGLIDADLTGVPQNERGTYMLVKLVEKLVMRLKHLKRFLRILTRIRLL